MTPRPSASSRTSARQLLLALWTTLAIIFVTETLIMVLLDRLSLQSMWTETLIDASLLTILTFPALYFFVYIPFKTYAAGLEQAERELHERDSQLRAVLHSAPLTIFATDRHGVFTVSEGKGLENVGLQPGENVGRSAVELYGDAPFVEPTGETTTGKDVIRRALAGEAMTVFSELRGVQFENHIGPLRDPDGAVAGIVGVGIDITDRTRAEDALRLQSAALNATANAILISDRDGTIEWANAAATTMLGYDAGELVGKNPREVFKSGVHDREFYTRMWNTLLAGRVWRGEMINRHKDGSLYTDDMTITPITDARGRIAHFIAVKQDITEKKRAEDQLREQADLLDLVQDAIVVRDLAHRITYWNKGAERLYGLTAADAIGRSVPEGFYRDPAVFYRTHDAVLRNGQWTGELTQLSADGREVTVESRWTLVHDRSGAPKSVLVINTDITERKKLEQQFLRAQRLESIGTLAGGIAHDLNNVLTPIMMSIDLLKLNVTDADSRAVLDTVGASARRGADIVGQVLSFARGLDGRRVEVQVKHLLREIEEIARETFPKDIVVRAAATSDVWTVMGDPTQLHQVLLNLCINARDAMPTGGQITITAANATIDGRYTAANIDVPPGPYVVIQVEDTGVGIPPAIIDKIFDPFFTTKAVGKGTGLGLSTSLTIVKQHGGFLQVTSEPGAGTRFLIHLPAHMESHDRHPDAAADLPPGHGETVLVVDDEPAIRHMMSRTLERFGYRVLLAAEGAEALAIYAEHASEIDVLIIDMMMPGMDGASTIQALVQVNPAVRIIAVSGIAESSLTLPGTFAGAMQFLPKPHSTGLLLKTLRHVLSGRGEDNPSTSRGSDRP